MHIVRSGVTRIVILLGPYAIKVPRPGLYGVRGWLANRSEWRQRHREDVVRPALTLMHLVALYPRADEVGRWEPENAPLFAVLHEPDDDGGTQLDYERAKGSSWGRFGDRWLLLDYDRSWEPPRGLVGQWYYGRQEKEAQRWIQQATPDVLIVDE